MAEEKKAPAMPHNLILEDRRTLTVSGVSDVDSFHGYGGAYCARHGFAHQPPERGGRRIADGGAYQLPDLYG